MTSSLQFSDYQDTDSRLKVNKIFKKSNMKKVKFPIEALVKEIKPVLTVKDELEYGEKSM